jgi:uncharacterized protein (TIGR02001 family)
MKMAHRLLGAAMLAATATAVMSAPAHAESTVSGNVALTSDYVFRGVSQTSEEIAIQGGFDYTNDSSLPFYAGVWGSSLDFGGPLDSGIEVDVYGGVRPQLGPVALDIGVIGYLYPGADIEDLDYVELKVGGSVSPAESLTLGAAAYWSPEFTLNGGDALYVEANAAYAFNDRFSVSGALGNQSVDTAGYFTGPGTSTDNYTTWNVGAAAAVHGFTIDVRYWDTDEEIANFDGEVVSDERFVVTLRRAL